jgi:hypothetical protein
LPAARFSRYRGAMSEPTKSARSAENESERRIGNLILLAIFVVIVGVGVWLVFSLDDARNADNCISQGRRNCAPIDVPQR